MRVFFACHRLPYPPKRGGKIRPFNIIRHLTELGHNVTVASLARSAEELEEGQPLRDYCDKLLVGRVGRVAAMANMIIRLPSPIPSSMGYFCSQALHRECRKELRETQYDLIFVHCSSAAQYVKTASGIPSILDFGDMDSQKWLDYSSYRRFPLSAGFWIEGTKLCREEKSLARNFDLSTCTTRAELETLQSFGAAQRSDWFPNGVDSEYFAPTDEPYDPDKICFIGRMDYYPNQQAMFDFCRDILPRIQAARPTTRLTIVGAEPSAEIRKLADKPGVTVTGTVPDVRDYVRSSALTVAPLAIARGTQNKILESMAMGVPVVCSGQAAKGVDAIEGKHLVTADNDEQYISEIVGVLDNADRRRELAVEGRNRVLTSHSWSSSLSKLDRIVESLLSEKQSSGVQIGFGRSVGGN